MSEYEFFAEARQNFLPAMEEALFVSACLNGKPATQREGWLSYLFARLCANGLTIDQLIETAASASPGDQMLDHFAIAAVGRTATEAAVVVMYVSEPSLSESDWLLRKWIFDLHDLTNRHIMFKNLGATDDPNVAKYDETRSEIVDKIKITSYYDNLAADERSKLVNGQQIFLGGIRRAIREAGWDVKEYDFHASYLSAFVHSSPLSFHRADMRQSNFGTITPYQHYLCG